MNIGGITIKDSAKVDKIYRSSRRVYLLYNKNKLQIRKKIKKKSSLIPTLRFFRRRRISPSISSLKWLTRHARRTHPYSSFPTTKRNMFVVPRVGRFPYRKGSKTIRARRATLFQSGSLVSRGKKTVGSRNPLEDQRGARKKCKNKIDAHAQCFHAGEFSAFVRPDLKELFWRRTRFEEEE